MDGCRVNVRLEHFRPDKLELSISGGLELMSNKSSNNLAASNTLWSQEYSVNGRLYLSNRLVIGTECQANLRQKMDAFDQNNNVVSWNGNVYYKIFPNRNGEFRFTAFDILNQQTGFWRWMQETMITDRRYQVLRQYFLLAFTWNFSKAPKDPATSK